MKKIPLTQGKFAMVDDEDFDFLNQWKWCLRKGKTNQYAHRAVYLGGGRKNQKATTIMMHRVILGVTDPKLNVDHRDCNGLNNQRKNIRICTALQNAYNKRTYKKYKGVYLSVNGKFFSKMVINGKRIHIGTFLSDNEAALAYNEAAKKYHGEFARLNVIE